MFLLDAPATQPNWITIVLSIIGSSTFSYFISLMTTNRVKKSEFDWAYKEYILNKRKEAYEKLNNAIKYTFYPKPDFYYNMTLLEENSFTTQELKKIAEAIKSLMTYSVWFSDAMETAIEHFRIYNEVLNGAYYSTLRETREKYNKTIIDSRKDFYNSITKLFWYDISKLSDIERFIKAKGDVHKNN